MKGSVAPSTSKSASAIQSQVTGDHFVIAGGQFNQWHHNHSITNINSSKGGFDRLQEAVSTTAFHNSAQRIDPPRCHQNTRSTVIVKIMRWIVVNGERSSWIMWLNGAAGAGKSAIAQSIAELCIEQGIPLASFFFYRTDPSRNHMLPLAATLAYQVARTIPATREVIAQAIEDDPLVFRQSLEYQLDSLVIDPIRQVEFEGANVSDSARDNPNPPLLIIIDGLDECVDRDAQTNLIRTVSNIMASRDVPILFLIASRPEAHITMAFNSRIATSILTCLALDHNYLPDVDIRRFLDDKFSEIRDTHPFKHLLPPAWPPSLYVDEIVEKSSGQFIFAAVVVNYVSSPRAYPGQRLEICRGLREGHSDEPFAQLDTLYRHIFSQVADIDSVLRVLAMAICGVSSIASINHLLDLAEGDVEICLADVTSVVICKIGEIMFLHASLVDFLCDPDRSGKYHINPRNWCAHFAGLWLMRSQFSSDEYGVAGLLTGLDFLQHAEPTPELHETLLNFVPAYYNSNLPYSDNFDYMAQYLSAIKELDFDDDNKAYDYQFSQISRYLRAKLDPTEILSWEEVCKRLGFSGAEIKDPAVKEESLGERILRWFSDMSL